MRIPSSATSSFSSGQAGPLAQVAAEIRQSLLRVSVALGDAEQGSETPDFALPESILREVRQVENVIRLFAEAGSSLVLATFVASLEEVQSGQTTMTTAQREALLLTCRSIPDYLDALLSLSPPSAIYLFPAYEALQQASGRLHTSPAALLFPVNPSEQPEKISAAYEAASPSNPQETKVRMGVLRQRFEARLLPILQGRAESENLASLAHGLKQAGQLATSPTTVDFWQIAGVLGEALKADQIALNLGLKQWLAGCNRYLRRLETSISLKPPPTLQQEALFLLASLPTPSPQVQALLANHHLHAPLPTDFRQSHDAPLNESAIAQMQAFLQAAKLRWQHLAESGIRDEAKDETALQPIRLPLSEAAMQQSMPALQPLLVCLAQQLEAASLQQPSAALRMEVAASILFGEQMLEQPRQWPADLVAHVEARCQRLMRADALLPEESGQQDVFFRQWQQVQAHAALVQQMQASLCQAEKLLEGYLDTMAPAGTVALEQVQRLVQQLQAVLEFLEKREAALTLVHLSALLANLAEEAGTDKTLEGETLESETAQPAIKTSALLDPAILSNLAHNMGALSFFLDELLLSTEQAGSSHVFDPVSALLSRRDPQQSQPVVLPEHSSNDSVQEPAPVPMAQADMPEDNASEAAPNTRAINEDDKAPVAVNAPSVNAAFAEAATAQEEAELRDIFLGEAMEMLACVTQTLPLCRSQPRPEHLIALRRCFHTIKGSGRMVGLTDLAEVAWEAEQQLNQVLAAKTNGNTALFKKVEQAYTTLHPWVDRLQQQAAVTQPQNHEKETLIKQEEAKSMLELDLHHPAEKSDSLGAASEQAEAALIIPPGMEVDVDLPAHSSVSEVAPFSPVADMIVAQEHQTQSEKESVEVTVSAAPLMPPSRDVQIGPLRLTIALHAIFLAEAEQLAQVLQEEVHAWKSTAPRSPGLLAVHAAHSLAGSSATVGFESLRVLSSRLEQVLHWLLRRPVALQPLDIETLSQSVSSVHTMLAQWKQLQPAFPALQQLHALQALQARLQRRDESASSTALVLPTARHHAARDVAISDDLFLLQSESIGVETAETVTEAEAVIPQQVALASQQQAVSLERDEASQIQRHADLTPQTAPSRELTATTETTVVPNSAETLLAQSAIDSLFEHDVALAQALAPRDELDPDLLPVFLEEGSELLPALEAALRQWMQQPNETVGIAALLRYLHTLKGSARMTGAMQLGQQLHQLESRIEQIGRLGAAAPALLEDLLEQLDDSRRLFERLRPQPQPTVLAPVTTEPVFPAPPATSAPMANQPVAASLLVRVRADLLEGLANQAGEIAIARSRVEDRIDAVHAALHDMNENVMRLQHQLREMEIQAESRIAAQQQWQGSEREFDPLEFDRFTRLQELTRMMAESVNDVSSVQQSLTKTTQQAQLDLAAQARLNRSLQEDLLRMRMVPFGSITERLYRVCRQTGKEMDKRVSLDIQGTDVDVDRQVLERMAGPLEHLLRNAVVHGIESESGRRAVGKDGVGQLQVQVRREGRQVVIVCKDDGQGLDMRQIRVKAESLGLVAADAEVTDDILQQWIFEPGFSTASQVTELAGRGIGMDVVRAEAEHLGGRVSLHSTAGQGTQFEIRLPLTLAVSQVVLVKAGKRTYALPAAAIEHVQQLKSAALAAAHQRGLVDWREQTPALAYLPVLLGEESAVPLPQLPTPVVIVRAAQGLLALHVDQVLGNREVVLKSAGPHLARVTGVAGATVLGSGEVVLILEPAAMQSSERPQTPTPTLPLIPAASLLAPSTAPALSSQPLVMVVDDSLTVRRVTQRLLLRAGYQVLLAKDGLDALEQLQSVTPDVMLLDIEMPRMDGFELTRHLRGNDSTRTLPIIMITSRTAAKHRRYAETLGVNAYLGKPYQDMALLEQVASCLKQDSTQREAALPVA